MYSNTIRLNINHMLKDRNNLLNNLLYLLREL